MRIAAFAAVLLVLGASAPAHAVSETAEGFAAAMQGCWNQTGWSDELTALAAGSGVSVSRQLCLEGGIEGALTVVDCSTQHDLTECSTSEGQYAFHDERFWQAFDGVASSCDVVLEPGKQVALTNCTWIDPPSAVEPIANAVYERAIGQ